MPQHRTSSQNPCPPYHSHPSKLFLEPLHPISRCWITPQGHRMAVKQKQQLERNERRKTMWRLTLGEVGRGGRSRSSIWRMMTRLKLFSWISPSDQDGRAKSKLWSVRRLIVQSKCKSRYSMKDLKSSDHHIVSTINLYLSPTARPPYDQPRHASRASCPQVQALP